MTPLPSPSLVFRVSADGLIPCAAQAVTIKVAGEAADLLDTELVRNAAAAVLHYFRQDLKRDAVSPAEFSAALDLVLRGFGLTHLRAENATGSEAAGMVETDLRTLVGDGLELLFFQRLREELRRQLAPRPGVVSFHSLRPCVMQLTGARRWSPRCQSLNDRIVDYLRNSLRTDGASRPCRLVVQ
jgi:hypothetical protein